jgi:hypothetical protein
MRWTVPLDEILAMKSNDAIAYQEEHEYVLPGITVADELEIDSIDDDYHQRIKKVMARKHINLVPVLVINDMVYNGHRRIMIAAELGLEEVLCTDDWDDSGWSDEDEQIVLGEENEAEDRAGVVRAS